MKKIILIIILLGVVLFGEDKNIKKALVKIYASHQGHNYKSPWQVGEEYNSTSTGFIVENYQIITNAPSVLYAKVLQVRKEGDSKKYKANVKFISADYDLAIIDVEDKNFYKETKQLSLGKLPELQENVNVYGYPLGGDKLSTTKGIVSRIEHNSYTLTNQKYLIGQTDAAINSGNSGGPVISKDKVVGVAFAGLKQADNIGYFIPVNVLKHFLNDVKDGKYDGSPSLGLGLVKLESIAYRKMLGLDNDSKGILVKEIYPNSPFEGVLQKNDVITKLDGKDIYYDGTIKFRKDEKTDLSYINQQKNYGDEISYEIVRNKEKKMGTVKLNSRNVRYSVVKNIPLENQPTYFVYGGLVFEPLTNNYLLLELDGITLTNDTEDKYKNYDEMVLLVRVLPYDINIGYDEQENILITKVNGEKYKNFKDFVDKVRNTKTEFIIFETEYNEEIVLDTKEVERQENELMENYNIINEASEDIK